MLQWNGEHLSYLGIHAASRKRQPVDKVIGAWSESVVHTSDEQIMGMIPE